VAATHTTSEDSTGSVSIYEVIEYVESRRAVTQRISPPEPVRCLLTHQVDPLGEGCILLMGMEIEVPAGAVWPQEQQDEWRRTTSRYLERVRSTLAAEGSGTA
jgi:hypothetical protein